MFAPQEVRDGGNQILRHHVHQSGVTKTFSPHFVNHRLEQRDRRSSYFSPPPAFQSRMQQRPYDVTAGDYVTGETAQRQAGFQRWARRKEERVRNFLLQFLLKVSF